MKTFSAFNQTASDNPNASPIKLVKIEFDGLTVYFCDRMFGSAGSENVFDGQIYEPLVLSWGDVIYGEVGQYGDDGTPSDFSFRVDNTVPVAGFDSFTSVFGTYKPIYSTVTLYEIYEGASASADLITKFVGTVEDVDMELEYVNVNCTSLEVSVANQFSVEICTEDDYAGADPDDWGKMLPIVYGAAKRVPFISVDAGAMSSLASDVAAGATSISGTDLTKFPQGGGTIQIDFEEITYTYIDSNIFYGCTRGANGTTAIGHDTGATIAEIQTEYFFIIQHPVHSINSVYVINRNNDENVLQDTSIYTAYTGQTGDEHASYPGKACIVFNTLPSIAPQVNLDVDDTIDVNDTIDVDDTILVNDPPHAHGGDMYGIWHTEYGYSVKNAVNPENAFNGDLGNYCSLAHGTAEARGQKLQAEELGPLPIYYRICVLVLLMDGGVRLTASFSGASFTTSYGVTGIFRSGWASASWSNWSQIQAVETILKNDVASGIPGLIYVRDAWIEFQQQQTTDDYSGTYKTGTAAKDGAAVKIGTVELVGNSVADTVIGGMVSADVQGWEADGSGNYGTSGSLIERPDYIFKHFLINYCGLSVSANIDSTSYTASGSLYSSDNVRLGVVITERPDMLRFLSSMAHQAKSYQFWESGKHYLQRVSTSESTDKTIIGSRIDINSVKVRYTPRDQIINRYVVNYDKHWIGDFSNAVEAYRGIITVDSSPSQAVYGVLEGDPISLDYVISSVQATRFGNWLLDDMAFPRLVVQFSGGQYLADLEKGDIVDFSFTSGDALDRRLLGLVVSESDQFRIMNMKEEESGRISIEAYIVSASTSNTGTFYPAALNDDGYTQGSNFYNTTIANVIGSYSGQPITSTTTTTTTTTTV